MSDNVFQLMRKISQLVNDSLDAAWNGEYKKIAEYNKRAKEYAERIAKEAKTEEEKEYVRVSRIFSDRIAKWAVNTEK